jgi:signal transduction histidine kinase
MEAKQHAMLHDFIIANRGLIIERARQRVRERTAPKSLDGKLEHGIPLFLTQLADALTPPSGALHLVGRAETTRRIGDSAALHGQDLLRYGFTVAQVVHGYGDVCQIVTELAAETDAAISAEEFHVFNRCLDDAIAGAVTAYGHQRERQLSYKGTERLGIFAHELRNLIHTAVLSFAVIKKGMVGPGGSTGAVHSRSLTGLRALVERSLAEVRLDTGLASLERISVAEFIDEQEVAATLQAEGYGIELTVRAVDGTLAVDADPQLLASATSNLLQNAFKYSRPNGKVFLTAHATEERVLIEVADECGGLPAGKADELFLPFLRGGSDRSGLGLGLTIALSAARANAGDLYVRDIPGHGCVFTIDLPRRPPTFVAAQHSFTEQADASGIASGGAENSSEPKALAG